MIPSETVNKKALKYEKDSRNQSSYYGFVAGAQWALEQIKKQCCDNCKYRMTGRDIYCYFGHVYDIHDDDEIRCSDWQPKEEVK